MKIAAVLFALSVCCIAIAEQAAAPDHDHGVNAYPSRSWKEMERRVKQGMEVFKARAKAFSQNAQAAQGVNVPTNVQELQQCANQDCPGGEKI